MPTTAASPSPRATNMHRGQPPYQGLFETLTQQKIDSIGSQSALLTHLTRYHWKEFRARDSTPQRKSGQK